MARLDLFQGVRSIFVGHPLLGPVALDDVPWLHVLWKYDHLVADGAACCLEDHGWPRPLLLAHTEREARSVRTGDDIA